jgi:hypothetical protein
MPEMDELDRSATTAPSKPVHTAILKLAFISIVFL